MYKRQATALQGSSTMRRVRTLAISLAALFIGAIFYAHNVRAEDARGGQSLHTISNAAAIDATRGQVRA